MRTQWNDEEDRALDYLPHVDQVIYLRGIRRRMDYETGVAGVTVSISYSWLSQLCEVHPPKGSHMKAPKRLDKAALRAIFDRLERAGLIERIRRDGERGLVFRCLLADVQHSDQMRSNPRTTPEQPQGSNPKKSLENNCNLGSLLPSHSPSTTPKSNPIQDSGIREEDPPMAPPPKTPKNGAWHLPSWLNQNAWSEFEQHRKDIRKPLSDMARTKASKQLQGLTPEQQQHCIDMTIQNRWTGLFPEKVNGHAKPVQHRQPSRTERAAQTRDEISKRAQRWLDPA